MSVILVQLICKHNLLLQRPGAFGQNCRYADKYLLGEVNVYVHGVPDFKIFKILLSYDGLPK